MADHSIKGPFAYRQFLGEGDGDVVQRLAFGEPQLDDAVDLLYFLRGKVHAAAGFHKDCPVVHFRHLGAVHHLVVAAFAQMVSAASIAHVRRMIEEPAFHEGDDLKAACTGIARCVSPLPFFLPPAVPVAYAGCRLGVLLADPLERPALQYFPFHSAAVDAKREPDGIEGCSGIEAILKSDSFTEVEMLE